MRNLSHNSVPLWRDLAVEAHALLRGGRDTEIEGVRENVRESEQARLCAIEILNEAGAAAMGRPVGHYITIDAKPGEDGSRQEQAIATLLRDTLRQLLPQRGPQSVYLLAGLGNREVTADALGPTFIDRSMATRQYQLYMPENMEQGFASVALVSPNVLGNTGVETQELIKGLVHALQPDAVIVVDALAAGAVSRVGNSFQLADTGIVPGSGVSNHRLALTEETVGAPVIAIGVPTVVYLHTIVDEILGGTTEHELNDISDEERSTRLRAVLHTVFGDHASEFAVTPKHIDELNDSLSRTLSMGVHWALHPALNADNIGDYVDLY